MLLGVRETFLRSAAVSYWEHWLSETTGIRGVSV